MCLLAGTEDGQVVFLDPPCEHRSPSLACRRCRVGKKPVGRNKQNPFQRRMKNVNREIIRNMCFRERCTCASYFFLR